MDPLLLETVVQQIHSSGTKVALNVTGGAAQARASNTVLEAKVPYATASLEEVLDRKITKFASPETAIDLAKAAYQQAAKLTPFGTKILGVGCTCALATDRLKKGDHKVLVAVHHGDKTVLYSLQLSKGQRDRQDEDATASRVVIKALAEAVGASRGRSLELHLSPGSGPDTPAEELQTSEETLGEPLRQLLSGAVKTVEYSGGQVIVNAPRPGRIYLPGSFNPLHDGHKALLDVACETRHAPDHGCFELSVGNPDKGLLPLPEVQRRVAQFVQAGLPLVVTQAPLFTQKAELFPRSTFAIGYDTAVRLVKPEYYGDETAMLLQFAALRLRGCGFLVAGRTDANGAFKTMRDVHVPPSLQRGGLFDGIPEDVFRSDLSSTQLRQRLGA